MPKIFTTLDKIRPAYDFTYKVVLFICKILLIADILITTMSVIGRYVPFIPDPSWSEEVVLTCMSYMAVLSAGLAIRRGAVLRVQLVPRGKANEWQIAQWPQADASFVAMDPVTGRVRALVGGFDFNRQQFNRATSAARR